ncbi:MAG: hypothetical protein K8R77_03930, partial [Anaerolineaceae bacterium]|nr:hypothetical protein [Anaerolineaceae bacterium]
FIINYDIKYRMGDELFNEGDEELDVVENQEAQVDRNGNKEPFSAIPSRTIPKAAAAVKMELPMEFSAYHAYRCLKCNKLIAGFDVENHTVQVHGGKYPGYEKLGG